MSPEKMTTLNLAYIDEKIERILHEEDGQIDLNISSAPTKERLPLFVSRNRN